MGSFSAVCARMTLLGIELLSVDVRLEELAWSVPVRENSLFVRVRMFLLVHSPAVPACDLVWRNRAPAELTKPFCFDRRQCFTALLVTEMSCHVASLLRRWGRGGRGARRPRHQAPLAAAAGADGGGGPGAAHPPHAPRRLALHARPPRRHRLRRGGRGHRREIPLDSCMGPRWGGR